MTDPDALPVVMTVTQSFASRMPTQRVIDAVEHAEGGAGFGDIVQRQPFRVVAFRALMRQFPARDVTSLWLHAYDVEVEITEVNPTNGAEPMPVLPSGGTGDSGPTT
jgi:hypothetical protein